MDIRGETRERERLTRGTPSRKDFDHMAAEGIFLQSSGRLTVLEQRDYDSEAVLQKALADFPEVLAGPTTTGEGDSRLLLVRREMGVPSAESGPALLSLDHLFLDAEGCQSWSR